MPRTLTTDQFIEKARSIHGDRYDYSKVDYVNAHKAVVITCPEHGDFNKTPDAHLRKKQGCARCSGFNKLNTDTFIAKAKLIHGDKYDYSKVCFIKLQKEVTIICSVHGDFQQIPYNHLSGSGCSKCSGFGFTYLSYEEAKKYVRSLGIKTEKEYDQWWKLNRPDFLPLTIDTYYKNHK